jgi:hypothetical protein
LLSRTAAPKGTRVFREFPQASTTPHTKRIAD